MGNFCSEIKQKNKSILECFEPDNENAYKKGKYSVNWADRHTLALIYHEAHTGWIIAAQVTITTSYVLPVERCNEVQ